MPELRALLPQHRIISPTHFSAQACTASTLGSLAHLLQCSVQLELEKAKVKKYTVIDTNCCFPQQTLSNASKLLPLQISDKRALEPIQRVKQKGNK